MNWCVIYAATRKITKYGKNSNEKKKIEKRTFTKINEYFTTHVASQNVSYFKWTQKPNAHYVGLVRYITTLQGWIVYCVF